MTPPTTQTGDWEKEFDKRFLAFTDPDIVDGFAKDEIKSFIRSEITKAVEAERARIIELAKRAAGEARGDNFIDVTTGDGYNIEAFDEGTLAVLIKLTTLTKEEK